MNQPQVYMCLLHPDPPPTSLPTLSLWVVPEHQLWVPSSCIELALNQCFSKSRVVVIQSPSHVQLFETATDFSTQGLPVPHYLPEFVQVHVHCIGDAIQLSHPVMPPSPSALNLSQHQRLFQ